mgnify:FL=1
MSKIRRTELPVHNVHRVRLVEQAVRSNTTPEGVFVTVSVIVEDNEGQEERIVTLYPSNGSINILV